MSNTPLKRPQDLPEVPYDAETASAETSLPYDPSEAVRSEAVRLLAGAKDAPINADALAAIGEQAMQDALALRSVAGDVPKALSLARSRMQLELQDVLMPVRGRPRSLARTRGQDKIRLLS